MTTIIEFGKDKTFSILLIGTDGLPALGKTVRIMIRRSSDNLIYDGAGSWSALFNWYTMTEIGTVGQYDYTVPGSAISTTEQSYFVTYKEETIPAYEAEEVIAKEIFTETYGILEDTKRLFDEELTTITADSFANKVMGDTFDKATDSLEAIRNRGDLAWITAIIPDIAADVWDALLTNHDDVDSFGAYVQDIVLNLQGAGTTNTLTSLAALIGGIQNSVFFSTTVLENYQRPDVGTRTVRIYAQVFDGTGSPVDADGNVTIRLDGSISGNLIDGAGSPANMTWESTGVYYYDYTIDVADNLEDWIFRFDYLQDSVAKVHFRSSQLSEFASDLNKIETDVGFIKGYTKQLFSEAMTFPPFIDSFADLIMNKDGSQTYDRLYDSLEALSDEVTVDEVIGNVTAGGSGVTLPTDLTGYANNYWNSMQIVMVSGGNMGQARIVSGYNTDGTITLNESFVNPFVIGDKFVVLSEYTSAASTLTTDGIASAVWNRDLSLFAIGTAGYLVNQMYDMTENIDIEVQYPPLVFKPSIGSPSQTYRFWVMTKDADGNQINMDSVQHEFSTIAGVVMSSGALVNPSAGLYYVDIVLNSAYTETQYDFKITTVKGSYSRIITSPVVVRHLPNLVDINEEFQVVLWDTAIPSRVAVSNSFAERIYNMSLNTSDGLSVPEVMIRPKPTGTAVKTYRVHLVNKSETGAYTDYDAIPSIRGDYVAGGVNIFNVTLIKDSIGVYHYDIPLTESQALGPLQVKASVVLNGVSGTLMETSEIFDYNYVFEIFDKLPSKDYLRGTDNITGEMDTDDKLVIEQEAYDALNVDLTSLPSHLPPIQDDSVNDYVSNIGQPDTPGDTLYDEHDATQTDIEGVQNSVNQIQNSTKTVMVVPLPTIRPPVQDPRIEYVYRIFVINYELNGPGLEDFIGDAILNISKVDGTPIKTSEIMQHPSLGTYYFDWAVPDDLALGEAIVRVDAEEYNAEDPPVAVPVTFIRTTNIVDEKDDELEWLINSNKRIEWKVDTSDYDTGLTIPQMIDILQDTPFLRITAPSVVAMNNGYTRIDNAGYALPIGSTTIPILEGSSDFFPDSGFIYLDDGVSREKLEYSSKTATSLVLASATTIPHDDGAPIYAIVSSEIRLVVEAQDKSVYHEMDDIPTILILNEFGTEVSELMVWDAVSRSYYYTHEYIATEFLAGKRNVIVTTFGGEGGVPAKQTFATFEVLDRPASQQSLDQAISGGVMPDTFVFDHDGWKDEANILHEWTDVMAGPLHDDTGKPATGILIRAFLKGEDDKWLLVNNPPFQNYSNIFGHYRGSLEAGTYLFTFYKDNHKWKEVERTIGE